MLNMSSSSSYGKVNEAEQARLDARRRTRRRIAIIVLSSILLVAVVVATVVGITLNNNSKDGNNGRIVAASIKAVCDMTIYKNSCYDGLSNGASNSSQMKPEELFKLAIKVASNELSKASDKYFLENATSSVLRVLGGTNDKMFLAALADCRELLSMALESLDSSLSIGKPMLEAVDDLKTLLSSASTYQATCIDGLEEAKQGTKAKVSENLRNCSEMTSNALAIVTWITKAENSLKPRRLMGDEVLPEERRLLLQKSPEDLKKKADAVVGKDRSAKYKTINDALKAVPDKSNKRFIIYVKKGVYLETVRVEKPKSNVMMIGDGMNETIVSGRLNFADGTPTFSTATFAVFGQGFIARDMGFRNTAGASKHQAVALMSTADHSVFYRCQFDAYQDTLYAHSNRQFYSECNIYGTVDFIFGNSAVVFQNCNILPRKPMPGQKNTITAQGKKDPNENTGIAIQNCTVLPFGDLTGVETYLGRPWKNYSTTLFMRSMMGSFINPNGWLPWVGNSAPNTIFYSEFENYGAGSSTKKRVTWKGLRYISFKEATKFTVKAFLQGDLWIPDAGVAYKSGL